MFRSTLWCVKRGVTLPSMRILATMIINQSARAHRQVNGSSTAENIAVTMPQQVSSKKKESFSSVFRLSPCEFFFRTTSSSMLLLFLSITAFESIAIPEKLQVFRINMWSEIQQAQESFISPDKDAPGQQIGCMSLVGSWTHQAWTKGDDRL